MESILKEILLSNTKYTLVTEFKEGQILQTLLDSQTNRLMNWVCDLREQGIREALIELGWTPPK